MTNNPCPVVPEKFETTYSPYPGRISPGGVASRVGGKFGGAMVLSRSEWIQEVGGRLVGCRVISATAPATRHQHMNHFPVTCMSIKTTSPSNDFNTLKRHYLQAAQLTHSQPATVPIPKPNTSNPTSMPGPTLSPEPRNPILNHLTLGPRKIHSNAARALRANTSPSAQNTRRTLKPYTKWTAVMDCGA